MLVYFCSDLFFSSTTNVSLLTLRQFVVALLLLIRCTNDVHMYAYTHRACGDVLVRTGYGTEAEVRAAKEAPLLAMAPTMRSKKGSGAVGSGRGGGAWAATKWSS